MTREEAITALGDRNNLLWGMSKEEKKYYSEALDMAISALSAIEDIKAEIKERIEMWGTDNDEYHDCLEIIDKHINKKGTWFDRGSLSCRCSACGCKNDKEEPICPNCKTEMEIGQ